VDRRAFCCAAGGGRAYCCFATHIRVLQDALPRPAARAKPFSRLLAFSARPAFALQRLTSFLFCITPLRHSCAAGRGLFGTAIAAATPAPAPARCARVLRTACLLHCSGFILHYRAGCARVSSLSLNVPVAGRATGLATVTICFSYLQNWARVQHLPLLTLSLLCGGAPLYLYHAFVHCDGHL